MTTSASDKFDRCPFCGVVPQVIGLSDREIRWTVVNPCAHLHVRNGHQAWPEWWTARHFNAPEGVPWPWRDGWPQRVQS